MRRNTKRRRISIFQCFPVFSTFILRREYLFTGRKHYKNSKKPHYFIFKDNGTVLWTDRIEAESESDAIEKANFAFHQLTQSEKEKMKSFLLFEGYDECDICGGFYEDDDSEGAWIIDREIVDFIK